MNFNFYQRRFQPTHYPEDLIGRNHSLLKLSKDKMVEF